MRISRGSQTRKFKIREIIIMIALPIIEMDNSRIIDFV